MGNITFLNPGYLLFLLFLSIPIFLHLFSRKKYKKVEFSSLKFIKLTSVSKIYFSKIKNILLLILRCLLIILLVLLLSKPIIKTKIYGITSKASNTAYIIILDNSYSMNYRDDKKTRFEKAKKLTKKIISSFDDTSKGYIICAPDYKVQDINKFISIKSNYQSFDMSSALRNATEHLKNINFPTKEIYILTDLQKENFKNLKHKINNDKINIYVFNFGKENDKNIFISSVDIPDNITVNIPFTIKAKISGFNLKKNEKVFLSLYIENHKIETKEINIYSEKENIIEFDYKFDTPGKYNGYLKLQDDNLIDDNKHNIHFLVAQNIKVLCLEENIKERKRTFYLKYALNPFYPRKEGMIIPTISSVANLSKLNLQDFDILILSDIKNFNRQNLQIIKNFITSGGELIFFLGDNIDTNFYNRNLLNFIEISSLIDKTNIPSYLTEIDFKSKIFDKFRNPQEHSFSQIKFFKYYNIRIKEDCKVIAKYDYKIPAVLEKKMGAGKIILFNTTPDELWTNFPFTPMYLPVLHSTIQYLYFYDKTKNFSVEDKRQESNLSKIKFNTFSSFFSKNLKYFEYPFSSLDKIERSGHKSLNELLLYLLFFVVIIEILILFI